MTVGALSLQTQVRGTQLRRPNDLLGPRFCL
jgi:hypothetical protein